MLLTILAYWFPGAVRWLRNLARELLIVFTISGVFVGTLLLWPVVWQFCTGLLVIAGIALLTYPKLNKKAVNHENI